MVSQAGAAWNPKRRNGVECGIGCSADTAQQLDDRIVQAIEQCQALTVRE
jgi:hypothetical protein